MPALANPRHERFARAYLKTGIAARAYLQAGYEPSNRNVLDASACRLLRHARVKARIAELQRFMTQKTKVSLESLVNELETAQQLAIATSQPGAHIQATQLKARLLGLLVERRETGAPGEFSGLTTVDQVLERLRAELPAEVVQALSGALVTVAPDEPSAVEPTLEGNETLN
jgi:hypothetical protein